MQTTSTNRAVIAKGGSLSMSATVSPLTSPPSSLSTTCPGRKESLASLRPGHGRPETEVTLRSDAQTQVDVEAEKLLFSRLERTLDRVEVAFDIRSPIPSTYRPVWIASTLLPACCVFELLSPHGQALASGGGDETIRLWNPATGQVRATLEGHTDAVYSVSYSPDGQTLASGSFDTLRLWDVASGQEITQLEGHTHGVSSVAYSPDGLGQLRLGQDDSVVGCGHWPGNSPAQRPWRCRLVGGVLHGWSDPGQW